MAYSIFSLLLYLGTVVWGVLLDCVSKRRRKNTDGLFTFWLYIFLCFGYMTGTDWRNYEPIYMTGEGLLRFTTEPISYFLFSFGPKIVPDFLLFMAIIKCCYLYSFIYLASLITDKWRACVGLMIMGQLSFLLIDGPIRYTAGLIFVNFALGLVFKKMTGGCTNLYYLKLFTLLICGVLCHNTCALFFLVVPLLPLTKELVNVNKMVLVVLYLIVAIVTSNIGYLSSLSYEFLSYMEAASLNSYSNYEIDDNSNILSIGNLFRIVFFFFVVITRDMVIRNYKYGNVIYNLAVFYCFLVRFFIIIPSGHRLPMPFSTFYIVYVFYLFMSEKRYGRIIFAYMFLSFVVNTWNGFNLIPYSNSIPYFIVGHKPYQERYYYNFYEYKERFGHHHDNYYLYKGV